MYYCLQAACWLSTYRCFINSACCCAWNISYTWEVAHDAGPQKAGEQERLPAGSS